MSIFRVILNLSAIMVLICSCTRQSDPSGSHKGYYFAIQTIDQWGNESELSNVVYSPNVVGSVGESALSSSVFKSSGIATATKQSVEGSLSGVINIKFSQSMRAALSGSVMERAARQGGHATMISGISAVDRAAAQIEGGVSYQRVFRYVEKHEDKARAHGLDLWYSVSFDGARVPVSRAISTFSGLDQIEIVESVKSASLRDGEVSNFIPSGGAGMATRADQGGNLPFNDPYLSRQWHYDNRVNVVDNVHPNGHISLFRAWKKQTGSPNVIVAILDTNMDLGHEDLRDALWVNQGEIPGNGIDDDNNGYIDDIHGWDFVINNGALNNAASHGTHVAGVVGAVNNNGIGVCGIAGGSGRGDGVKLMNCSMLEGGQSPNKEAQAIKYSADNGAVIAQCSWGFDQPNVNYKVMEDAIDYFIAQAGNAIDFPQSPMRGGVVVCAMGNDGRTDDKYYPAAYTQTISVSSTNIKGKRPTYSNVGYWVTIAAPGGADPVTDSKGPGVMSCVKGGYGSMSGTSMAAPHVSGIAALIVADNPGITADQLREKIETSGKNTDTSDPDFLALMGGGCINSSKYLAVDDKTAPVTVKDLDFRFFRGVYQFVWSVPVDHGEDEITQTRIYYHWEPITAENISKAKQYKFSNPLLKSGMQATLDIKRIADLAVESE